MSSPASSANSLFDESCSEDSEIVNEPSVTTDDKSIPPASLLAPIPGLFLFPSLLSHDAAQEALEAIGEADHFLGGSRDQVMLFTDTAGLPPHIEALDKHLEALLTPHLPEAITHLAFQQPLARQVILNLYTPGQGLGSHIDLPNRYADGIAGVSLTGGCVMTFERAPVDSSGYRVGSEAEERYDIYLPPRSVYVLSGPARWEWAHSIPSREMDLVQDEEGRTQTLPRSLRVSVTFRWLTEGGGVLS